MCPIIQLKRHILFAFWPLIEKQTKNKHSNWLKGEFSPHHRSSCTFPSLISLLSIHDNQQTEWKTCFIFPRRGNSEINKTVMFLMQIIGPADSSQPHVALLTLTFLTFLCLHAFCEEMLAGQESFKILSHQRSLFYPLLVLMPGRRQVVTY